MIKIGDKLVCTKNSCIVIKHAEIKNKIFEVKDILKHISSDHKTIAYIKMIDVNVGAWFNLEKNINNPSVDEYFITLAEWREKQIKSVIDV